MKSVFMGTSPKKAFHKIRSLLCAGALGKGQAAPAPFEIALNTVTIIDAALEHKAVN